MALTGQFEVQSNWEAGFEFINNQNTAVSYTFSASGFWSPNIYDANIKKCEPDGLPSLPPVVQQGIKDYFDTRGISINDCMKYSSVTPYALVAQNKKTGEVIEIGKKATILLKPGETLVFVLNDYHGDYINNSGSIKVEWSGINLVSKVMQFDGDKDYVRLPDMDINYSGGFSVEAWVWFENFGNFTRIIEFSTGAGDNTTYNAIIFSCGEKAGVEISDLDLGIYHSGPYTERVARSVLEKRKWTHVAATVDPYGNGIVYKNGQQVGFGTGLLPTNVKRTINSIGGSLTYPGRDLKGKMAEVRIWNKARTQQEIQADMSKRLSGGEPNLVGYWPLNEVRGEGSSIKTSDFTNKFHGTVTGAILVEDITFPVP